MTSANKPYGLNRPRDEYYFKGEKILALRMTHDTFFPYVSGDSYVARTFLVIKPKNISINLKYLSCLLNSRLSKFWFFNFGKRKGNMLQIDKEPLLNFPIKQANTETVNQFITLFDRIVQNIGTQSAVEDSKSQAKVRDLQSRINELVYKLYGLTPEEIKIVET